MSAVANDFDVWQLGAPVVEIGAGGEFDFWQYQTPVVTQDESNPNTQPRRRASEY